MMIANVSTAHNDPQLLLLDVTNTTLTVTPARFARAARASIDRLSIDNIDSPMSGFTLNLS
jgi:hypothetical protein